MIDVARSAESVSPRSVRHYFLDEAGDGTLFNRTGQVTVGNPGCSRFFILGLLDISEPVRLARDLEELRTRLLADPYFEHVPSMQVEAKKTARAFHATDDVPEVRRKVFSLLKDRDVRFLAVVKNKSRLLEYVRQRNQRDPAYRYNANELYDFLVRRLCKTLLHKDDQYRICFARRGHSGRTRALRLALQMARRRFNEQYGLSGAARLHISARNSAQCPELQAVDYFLWALQRLYERQEERYVKYLWKRFSLVVDLDDTSRHRYGEYYSKRKPLSLAALKDLPGI